MFGKSGTSGAPTPERPRSHRPARGTAISSLCVGVEPRWSATRSPAEYNETTDQPGEVVGRPLAAPSTRRPPRQPRGRSHSRGAGTRCKFTLFGGRRFRSRCGVNALLVEVKKGEEARCLVDCVPRRAKYIYPPVAQEDVEVPFPLERIERNRAEQGLEPSREMPLTVQPPNDYLTEINAKPEHGTLISSVFPNVVPETLAEETVDDLEIFWPVL